MTALRLTEEQLRDYQNRRTPSSAAIPKRSKYGNVKVVDPETGDTIDSKKEAEYLQELRAKFRAGEIIELSTQHWIRLGATRKMIVDFYFVESDGTRRYVDVKGYATADWKTKQAWAREQYGIEVETI